MLFIPVLRGTSASAKLIYKFFVYDTSVTTAAGLSGKAYSDFTVKYIRQGEALSGAITPENITTIGTYAAPTANTNCRIKEISASAPCVGYYELQIHADWVATTNTPADLTIFISVTGGKIAPIEIPLTTFDLQAAIAQTTDGFMRGILATALTETSAGYLAAAFKKFLDVATPVFTAASVNQTGDSHARLGAPAGASVSADIAAVKVDTAASKVKTDYLPSATAGAAGGLFIAGSNAATTVNITGNISGSIGTVAANGITATSIAADAINAAAIKADAITKIQNGLSTSAELAKVPKSDSNVTWNATALASINAEVDTALNTAIPGSPTADSINERIVAIDGYGVPPAVSAIADGVWDEALSGHSTSGTAGKKLTDLVNADLSGVATSAELAKVPKSDSNVTWNATALGAINAEVDTALNTAIPGSPTADSINERIVAIDGYGAPPTVAAIADGVWDESLSGHSGAGSAGLALSTASSGGVDPSVLADAIWDEALSGHSTSGTAGKKLTDLVNADLSGVATSAELAKVPKSDSNVTFNATALASINTQCDTALSDVGLTTTVTGRIDASITSRGIALDAAGVRSALGVATANIDTQLADIPTVAEFNARTIVAANYALDSTVAKADELAKVPKSDSNVTWNATALASINAEVDTALNTAIPGSPTADSINERIVAIDGFGAPPTVAAISDGVWDELTSGHTGAGSTGAALSAASAPSAAAVADAVWDEALSGHSTAGTAGLALATASSGGVDPSVLADAIWDEALSGHTTAGTAGKALSDVGGVGTVDANVISIDGQLTNGNNATLNLKQLNVVNSAGDAIIATSSGSNGSGIKATGHGTGSGLLLTAGGGANSYDLKGATPSTNIPLTAVGALYEFVGGEWVPIL